MESLCQRSFRPLLKYRTIVLYLLFTLIPVGHNYYLFFVLLSILHSFPRSSRDHPERHCRVSFPFMPVPFLLHLFLLDLACSFFVFKGNNPRVHLMIFCTLRARFYIYTDLHTKSNNIFRHCCLYYLVVRRRRTIHLSLSLPPHH